MDNTSTDNISTKQMQFTGKVSEMLILFCGIFFLYQAFEKITDLQNFHAYLLKISFLPYWMSGAGLIIIPGLLLTLGLVLTFTKKTNTFGVDADIQAPTNNNNIQVSENKIKEPAYIQNSKESILSAALLISFIVLLTALTIAIYTAFTASPGCSSCPKLRAQPFNFKIWLPAVMYLVLLLMNIGGLLLNNQED